jgi:hypothetical protein
MTADYHEERTIFVRCLAPLSKMFQLYRVGQFIGGGNRGILPTCPKSLPNLSHNVVSSTPRMILIRTHNFIADKDLLHRYI